MPGAPRPDINTKLRAFPAPDPKVIANRLGLPNTLAQDVRKTSTIDAPSGILVDR
jgi:hypothetical protein